MRVEVPSWSLNTDLPHVYWQGDDFMVVVPPEEIEEMDMSLNDQNAVAVSLQCADRVHDLIRHFQAGKTWAEFGPGDNEEWLEQVKMDLTMLASVVEARIQEISTTDPQDFGTPP